MTLSGVRVTRTRESLTRWLRNGALALLAVSALLVPATRGLFQSNAMLLGWYLAAASGLDYLSGGLFVAALVSASARLQRTSVADVEVRGDLLVLRREGQSEEIPVAELRGGMRMDLGGRPTVRLTLRSGDRLELEVSSREVADQLLADLGLGPAARSVEVALHRVNRPLHIYFLSRIAMMVLWVSAVMTLLPREGLWPNGVWMALLLGLPAILPFVAAAWWWPERVVVGSDGVSWARRGRSRFIPYSAIQDMRLGGDRLNLSLRDGTTVSLRALRKDASETLAALQERMRAASLAEAPGPGASAEDALVPGSRTVADWLHGLETLVNPAHPFRDASLEPSRLEAVLEGSAGHAARVGAAFALARSGAEDAPQRIRVAAQRSASPRLRFALESIAAGEADRAAIEGALAEEEALAAAPSEARTTAEPPG